MLLFGPEMANRKPLSGRCCMYSWARACRLEILYSRHRYFSITSNPLCVFVVWYVDQRGGQRHLRKRGQGRQHHLWSPRGH